MVNDDILNKFKIKMYIDILLNLYNNGVSNLIQFKHDLIFHKKQSQFHKIDPQSKFNNF